MASSKANLSSLPAELLLSILYQSRELSLINVCREFRACLPPFSPIARSLAVLAFSKVNHASTSPDGQYYQGPVMEPFLQEFRSALDEATGLAFPLSPEQRAHLQQDVLCSGWWNINRFHAVHLFLFRYHLLSLEARLSEDPFRIPDAQIDSFKQYIRNFETHWSLWTTPRKTMQEPDFPFIMPWKSMPNYYLHTDVLLTRAVTYMTPMLPAVTVESTDISMNQHAFVFQRGWHMPEYWNIMRVNNSDMSDNVGPRDPTAQMLENRRLDGKGRKYFLPPRPLLVPPFTARKRGILVYLIQEAAGRYFITDIPDLNHNSTREDDERILSNAILEAIPIGDIPFLKILLTLLQGQNPPHLSPDQSYTGALIAPVAGTQDRAMVQLYIEEASWSREEMDRYVLTAMRSGNPDVLSVLLDIYAVYDRRIEEIERFAQRMSGLLDKTEFLDDASHDQIRDVVTRKIKSMKAAAIRSSDYARDKWLVESGAD
ncbi:uncharacterized protein A1O9_12437 [Exophiala aquamarina CBS 119918]|uniref:F-box domain-containing protein n=1 Tax=Exophiala aquamarina CBS 119918 TaxID=1182545 RepID=A0A072P7D8_9EURO|nr:uncharacterized protein A1O9_12437 [Exophiala aquamarina CBS 119918]KEF51520.1 hypothetical protein A1O9_12437 [Exophiala aquamarina CBS 119918]